MSEEQRRPEGNRPNPETTSQNDCFHSTASVDADAFAFRQWKRWRLHVIDMHERGIAPMPQAVAAAVAIYGEWHVEGQDV